ncbi:MAG: DUF4339 domain-containing protein [Luteolibacter sp.]
MNPWYYAQSGQQKGPVPWEALRELAASGLLAPTDMVWTASMAEWKPAGTVEGLFGGSTDPIHPTQVPGSNWISPMGPEGTPPDQPEIEPGSSSLGVMACLVRATTVLHQHFAMIFLVGLTYFAITFATGQVMSTVDRVFKLKPVNFTIVLKGGTSPIVMRIGWGGVNVSGGSSIPPYASSVSHFSSPQDRSSPVNQLVQKVVSLSSRSAVPASA